MFVYQAVKKIEFDKLKSLVWDFCKRSRLRFASFLLIIFLAYTLQGMSILQIFYNMDLNLSATFTIAVKFSLILAMFFVIISRNSFQDNNYIYLYLNTNVKAYQIILTKIVLHFFLYFLTLILLTAPLLIFYILQGYPVNYFYLFLAVLLCVISYFLVFTLWMLNKIIIKRIIGVKERFWINALFQGALIIVLIYFIDPFIDILYESWLLHFAVVLSLAIGIGYLFIRYSLSFLNINIIQKDAGPLSPKYKNAKIVHQNKFILQAKLKIIHMFRDQVLKEQSFFFLFIIIFTIGIYQTLDPMYFSTIFLIFNNFGLKAIILILPLMIGIHYREYIFTVFQLNVTKSSYLYSRLLIMFLLNCFIYMLFLTLTTITTSAEISTLFETITFILFITVLSSLIGFMVKITEENRIYIILFLLLFVNFFDLFLKQLQILTLPILVNFTYLSIVIIMFFIIETYYLRKPITR